RPESVATFSRAVAAAREKTAPGRPVPPSDRAFAWPTRQLWAMLAWPRGRGPLGDGRRRGGPPPQKKVSMKKFLFASLLALALTAAAGQEASAHGNWSLCFGISWNCWSNYCFPCVDPCLFGLPNGGGYAGYGQPAVYQAPP